MTLSVVNLKYFTLKNVSPPKKYVFNKTTPPHPYNLCFLWCMEIFVWVVYGVGLPGWGKYGELLWIYTTAVSRKNSNDIWQNNCSEYLPTLTSKRWCVGVIPDICQGFVFKPALLDRIFSLFLPRNSHFSRFHSIQVLNLLQFSCFSWGKICFERFHLFKKFDISQLCILGHFLWVYYVSLLLQQHSISEGPIFSKAKMCAP